MGWVWSTQVEIHFFSSPTLEGIGQHKLRYILWPRWYGMSLINTCCDGLSARAGMVLYGQHMLGYILCFSWHMR